MLQPRQFMDNFKEALEADEALAKDNDWQEKLYGFCGEAIFLGVDSDSEAGRGAILAKFSDDCYYLYAQKVIALQEAPSKYTDAFTAAQDEMALLKEEGKYMSAQILFARLLIRGQTPEAA